MVRSESKTSVIYLAGMPGCGKTTLGKQLAKELAYDFVDLDDYIEKVTQVTISEIFEKEGESVFRKIEQQAVEDASRWENTVVALGGGAPCFFDNMQVLNSAGTTVFVDVSAHELMNRLAGEGQENRPILANKTREELLQEIEDKLKLRNEFYSQADLTVTSDNIQVSDLLKILE